MYTYADGGRFEGEWIDDKVHGRGVSVYASGNRYEGEWVDGKINGQVRACRVRVHPAALLAERGRVRRVAGYALVRWGRSVPGRVEGWQDARARHLHLRGGRQASLPRRPRRGGGATRGLRRDRAMPHGLPCCGGSLLFSIAQRQAEDGWVAFVGLVVVPQHDEGQAKHHQKD